jgi:uncharacterized membrane protein HdeD (DUF308 family)
MNTRNVGLLALRGVIAVIFGLLAIVWPGVTIVALAVLFGAYVLVDGAFTFLGAFRRELDPGQRAANVVIGLLSVVAGVLVLVWPDITALVLVVLAGVWLLASGIVALVMAARQRGHGPLVALGVVSVGAGILILIRPDVSAVALAVVVGVYALIAGVLMLVEAWRQRRSPYTAVPAHG